MQSGLILEDAVLTTWFEETSSLKTSKQYQASRPSRLDSIISAATALQSMAHRHPRRVSAAVLTLLAGSAMTAFGVAPLAALPQAPTPVVTQISENIQPPELQEQLQRLDAAPLTLYRSDVTRSADTVDSLLQRQIGRAHV